MQWPQCGVFGEQRTEQSAATVAAKRRMPRASIIKTESPCLERSSMASRIKFGHCVVFPDPVSPATMTWARSLQRLSDLRGTPWRQTCCHCHLSHLPCRVLVCQAECDLHRAKQTRGSLHGFARCPTTWCACSASRTATRAFAIPAKSSILQSFKTSRLCLLPARLCESLREPGRTKCALRLASATGNASRERLNSESCKSDR